MSMALAPNTFIQEDTSDPKPIPAFYCCYLLRSTVRHASLYVGSTPNPARRLTQHNGIAKGGARRTARDTLRPWEMVTLVEGFMSRTGALQFEWAWQSGRDSRHIEQDNQSSTHTPNIRSDSNKGTGKRGGPRRKARSLTSHLTDLHLLLRSSYFSRWPLTVRFLSQDVHTLWKVLLERVDGLLPDTIQTRLDAVSRNHANLSNICPSRLTNGVGHVDVSYNNMKGQLEKTLFLLDDSEIIQCDVCREPLQLQDDLIVVCPQPDCRSASHMVCLSKLFLTVKENCEQLVPTSGTCPACDSTVIWRLLMMELSLRLRGEKETQNIFKTKRSRRPHSGNEDSGEGSSHISPDGQQKIPDRIVSSTNSIQADNDVASLDNDLYKEYSQDDLHLDESWIEAVDVGYDSDSVDPDHTEPQKIQSCVEIVIDDSEEDGV